MIHTSCRPVPPQIPDNIGRSENRHWFETNADMDSLDLLNAFHLPDIDTQPFGYKVNEITQTIQMKHLID